ncbi:MAG TPA: hypothetical protein VF411_06070, partial [Bacteroidia bacterium]
MDIKSIWSDFIKTRLIPYKIMDKDFYSEYAKLKVERKTLNKHIISESDLVNEFVIYLKQTLASEGLSVHCDTVHSHRRNSIDISIHDTKSISIFRTQKEINDTAKYLIEVKYIPSHAIDAKFGIKKSIMSDVEH